MVSYVKWQLVILYFMLLVLEDHLQRLLVLPPIVATYSGHLDSLHLFKRLSELNFVFRHPYYSYC